MSSTPKQPAAEAAWTLAVRGGSMRPLLKAGDVIAVERAPAAALRAGELVVLLGSRAGEPEYVAHRLLAWLPWAGRRYALTKGDGNLLPDRPVAAAAVIGRVSAARVGEDWLGVEPALRRRGWALCVLAAPAVRAFTAAEKLSETLARGLFHRFLGPLGLRAAQAAVLKTLAWRDRRASEAHSWLQRRCAAAALGAPARAPAGARARLPALGILEGTTTWSGDVEVAGDVYVPPGACLRVAAGARLRFAERSRWDYLDEARLSAPWGREAGPPCRLFVAGRLLVEGTQASPVVLEGVGWGGLHLVGDSIGSSLEHVQISGCGLGVAAWDHARAAVTSASLEDCGRGLSAEGPGAELIVDGLSVAGCREAALAARRGSLRARACRLSDCGEGVRAEDGGRAEIEDVSLSVCRGPALAARRGSLSARSFRASDCGEGVSVEDGGRAEIEDFSLTGCRGPALAARGGGLSARSCRASDCGEGVRVENGAASVEDLDLRRCERAAVIGPRGLLTLARAAARGCAEGFSAREGRVDMRAVAIEDCGGTALEADRASVSAEDVTVRGCADGLLLRGGLANWKGGRVSGCRRFGLAAEAGELRGENLEITECGSVGALCEAEGALTLRETAITACPVGVAARGTSLFLDRVSASGARDTAFVLDGRAHRLRDVRAADAGCGLSIAGAKVEARGVELSRCAAAIRQRAGALRCAGLRALACAAGLELSEGEAVLEDARFESSGAAAAVAGASTLRWKGGGARGAGVRVAQGAVAALEDIDLRDGSGHAVELDDASLSAAGLRLEGWTLDGVSACRPRLLRLERFEVARCRFALALQGGSAALASCGVDDCAAAVRCEDAELDVRDLRSSGCGDGIGARGGRLSVARARIERCGGAAIAVERDGRLAASDVEASGAKIGLALEGEGDVEGLRLLGCATGVEVRAGALRWTGGAVRGGETALAVGPRGRARAAGLAFEAPSRSGAWIDGGALAASRCSWTGAGEQAVRVENGGALELRGCRLARAPIAVGARDGRVALEDCRVSEASQVGVSFQGGRHRLERVSFHGCVDAVHADAAAIVERVEPPPPGEGSLVAAARGWVLRTRRWPALGALYRAAAGAPVRLLQLWAISDRRALWLGAHRSWTSPEWQPGSSDVDLLLCAGSLGDAAGRAWLGAFWRRLGRLKRAFPFLGECLVAEAEDLTGYMRWGGFRARDLRVQVRTLAGRLPPPSPRAASGKTALEPFGEAAHAYTRLMSWAAVRSSTPAAATHAAKAALDLLRLRHAGESGGLAALPSRSAALEAAGPAASPYVEPLRDLAAAAERGLDDAGARARLRAAGLGTLQELAGRAEASLDAAGERVPVAPSQPAAGPAAETELARRRAMRETLSRALGPALIAGCCDDVYRSWLVLDDAAPNGGWERIFAAADLLPREAAATLPILLTRRAWRVWARLPYLESPLRFLEPGDGRETLRAAGAGLPGVWQYSWGGGELSVPAPPAPLLLDLGREAAATLRCQWRFHASPASGLSAGYALHYLTSRALSLRLLLERGLAAPTFALDDLGAVYEREFPADAAALCRHWQRQAALDGAFDLAAASEWADGALRALPLS